MKDNKVYVITTPRGKALVRTTLRGPENGGYGYTVTEGWMYRKAARAVSEIYAVEHQGEQDEEHTRAGNGRCSRRKSRTTRLRSRTKTTGTRGGRASRGRLAWDGIALQRPMRGYGVGYKRGETGHHLFGRQRGTRSRTGPGGASCLRPRRGTRD